jgi:hypothetical protein
MGSRFFYFKKIISQQAAGYLIRTRIKPFPRLFSLIITFYFRVGN